MDHRELLEEKRREVQSRYDDGKVLAEIERQEQELDVWLAAELLEGPVLDRLRSEIANLRHDRRVFREQRDETEAQRLVLEALLNRCP